MNYGPPSSDPLGVVRIAAEVQLALLAGLQVDDDEPPSSRTRATRVGSLGVDRSALVRSPCCRDRGRPGRSDDRRLRTASSSSALANGRR